MKCLVSMLLVMLATQKGYGQTHDTMHIYFELDKTQINDRGIKMIDSIIKDKRRLHETKITIMGYADYLGTDAYDKTLSESRARNVEDYLVVSGYNKDDIKRCVGKGKVNRAAVNGKKGFSDDRKVDIIFDGRKDTSDELRFRYDLEKMQVEDAIPIRNLEFYQGSLRMMPESFFWLDMLVAYLKKNNTIIFQLEGHVCCLGFNDGRDEPYDEGTLSQKRAQGVADYLIKNGIARERLKAALGLGNINPIRDEESGKENEPLSRRVELRIISK